VASRKLFITVVNGDHHKDKVGSHGYKP
jgi:hypothetical protein